MADHKLIYFIESYINKDTELDFNVFTVNVRRVDKHFYNLPFLRQREDVTTITLDEEDLKYLYNKYKSKYEEAILQQQEEIKIKKEKEIKDLEEKLNRFKNGK